MTALDDARLALTKVQDSATAVQRVVDDLSAPTPPPSPGFGISMHALTIGLPRPARPRPEPDKYVARLAATGARWLRDDFYPGGATVQLDTILRLVAQNGRKLVLILWGGGAPPPLATMQSGAASIVGYAERNFPGTLLAVEPSNEPNINPALSTPATYRTFANAVYDGVKSASANVQVWAGATAGCALAWAPQVLQLGLKRDAWSCHPYPAWGFFPDAAGMLRLDIVSAWAEFPKLGPLLTANGYGGVIHATEGFNCPTGACARCSPEPVQADVFRQSIATWRTWTRAGIPFFYDGEDDLTGNADPECNFGARRSDGSAKPVVSAMLAAA